MNIAVPSTAEVKSVGFSFYTAKQIRRLSVKAIDNPVLFDVHDAPMPGGLYDPALGPLDRKAVCATCHQDSQNCPGHFGHIELAVPVYNPISFPLLYKLLQSLCFYCHRLRLSRAQVLYFCTKLTLIRAGLIVEAAELDSFITSARHQAAQKPDLKALASRSDDAEDADMADGTDGADAVNDTEASVLASLVNSESSESDRRLQGLLQTYLKGAMSTITDPAAASKLKSIHATEMLRHIEKTIMKAFALNGCPNCGGISPRFRKDTNIKVFQRALSQKNRLTMENKGMSFEPLDLLTRAKARRGSASGSAHDGASTHASSAASSAAGPTAGAAAAGEGDDDAVSHAGSLVSAPTVPGALLQRKATLFPTEDVFLPPSHVRAHMRMLWRADRELLDLLYGQPVQGTAWIRKSSYDMFFMHLVPVAPTRFRPASKMGDMVFENPSNLLLTEVLKANRTLLRIRQDEHRALAEMRAEGADASAVHAKRSEMIRRSMEAWTQLQAACTYVIDSSKAPAPMGKVPSPGVRQTLEKKEGLFRKHMMGKRVNYAARSVISPDPNIETYEIGIPPVFATTLTYPEPVTKENVKVLADAVINGPKVWPGAKFVRNEDGSMMNLASLDIEGRRAVANSLLMAPTNHFSKKAFYQTGVNKQVYRHLRNGDFVLMNRQPTLHKPSIQGFTARVLPGEKTLRMHFARCNAFNADFDGDEMNCHFPQSELGRAEAMVIARTDQQYLVPTDGGVLSGLIQDHVCAGVDMTARGTLLSRDKYMQLLYVALRPDHDVASAGDGNIEQRLLMGDRGKLITLPPAIVKPRPMWTGKQVISTILLNLTYNQHPLNMISKAKVPAKAWGGRSVDGRMQLIAPEEDQVVVMEGDLVTGVLDKSQFGATSNGLVHCIYEVYGAPYAGKLLGILGRLFTHYWQHFGLTCRFDDLRLTAEGDVIRRELIAGSSEIGLKAAADYVKVDMADAVDPETRASSHMLQSRLEAVVRDNERLAGLDSAMKEHTNRCTSSIINTCVPGHLYKPFPANNLQLMTVSGAKGSPVNVSQISCCLGQQELEGRRVPVMISGKTLPSFRAFDPAARAGGFITGRFLTGIKPQEYFFHCMAGREGLIDTAVKTSRSGYLQRCLIKHLEGISVHYDHTVRDSDGSVLQFHYGEDSLDILKQTTLTKFAFNAMNYRALLNRYDVPKLVASQQIDLDTVPELRARQADSDSSSGSSDTDSDDDANLMERYFPSRYLGATSNKFHEQLESYLAANPDRLLANKHDQASIAAASKVWAGLPTTKDRFRILMDIKYMRSLIDPGEAVGLVAAQSIGEPSTQMTLNTFHFAGLGAKNVTLGIPRLREIIMTASAAIKTPTMDLELRPEVTAEQSADFCRHASRVLLNQVVEHATVHEVMRRDPLTGDRSRVYTVRLQFWPQAAYTAEYGLGPSDLEDVLERAFVRQLEKAIGRILQGRRASGPEAVGRAVSTAQFDEFAGVRAGAGGDADADDDADKDGRPSGSRRASAKHDNRNALNDDDAAEDGASDDEAGEGDATAAVRARRQQQHASYDAPDDDDEAVIRDVDAAMGAADVDMADEAEDVKPAVSTTSRAQGILATARYVTGYKFDRAHGRWAEVELTMDMATKKILMLPLVEQACALSTLHEIRHIERCFPLVNDASDDKTRRVCTEGVNFAGMWEFADIINVNTISTNDIAAVLRTYGVEAARASIMQQIAGVFDVYGIKINTRHLTIIADYMTFEGGYKPFNRMGIASNASPFAQMSFETTATFLTAATQGGDFDDLRGPSASIVLGQPVKTGTGAFELRQALAPPVEA